MVKLIRSSQPSYIVFDHTNHIKLWQWLADNPTKDKCDWPEWKENGGNIKYTYNYCFACYYIILYAYKYDPHHSRSVCSYCPFGDLGNSDRGCLGGLYHKWKYSSDLTRRSEVAKQIRDLPIRTDMEVPTK